MTDSNAKPVHPGSRVIVQLANGRSARTGRVVAVKARTCTVKLDGDEPAVISRKPWQVAVL
mgnify:CR=1 FL=1